MTSTRTSRIASLAMFALAGVGTAFALSGPASATNQIQCTGTTTPVTTSGSVGASGGTSASAGTTTPVTTSHHFPIRIGVGTASTGPTTISASGSGATTGASAPSASGSNGITVNAGSVGDNGSIGGVVNGLLGGATHQGSGIVGGVTTRGKGLLGAITGNVGTGNGILGSGNGLLGGLNLFGNANTSANQSGGLSVNANASTNGASN